MMAEMEHEQATEEIEAVALGIAPEEVTDAVVLHAARCPECAAELRSFYQVVTALAALIPARQLNRGHSAGIKSRLVAKTGAAQDGAGARRMIRAEPTRAAEPRAPESRAQESRAAELRPPVARQLRAEAEPLRAPQDRSSMPIWIAVVATLIALGSIAALLNERGSRQAFVTGDVAEAEVDDSRITQLESRVAEQDSTIASLSGRGVRIISLYNREATEPLARMFWDRRRDRWTLFVYSLRQPRPGKTFQVWLGTDGGRVPLGTFQPNQDGSATFRAAHPIPIAALRTVSISEEDSGGGATAPTGPVVLAGALR